MFSFVVVAEQFPAPQQSVDNNTKLGSYNAAVTPLLMLCLGIACGTYAYQDFVLDPRVQGWFLIESPTGMIVISVAYIMFSTVWGPRWMEKRKPLQLKWIMIFYNGLQVVFSLYMFIEVRQ